MTRVIGLPNGKNITVITLNDVYDVVREYVGDDAVELIKDSMEEEYFVMLNYILNELYSVGDILKNKIEENGEAYNKVNNIITRITDII